MDFASLHELLRSTYDDMLPLSADMMGIAKGIAGLGALFYIALRVWASLARAESIDVFPLLRPFVLGFCIMFFPSVVLGTMNAVLSPIVSGTEAMVHKQTDNLTTLRKERDRLREEAYMRNPETAYLVSNEKFDEKIEEMGIIGPEDAITIAGMYAERAAYQTKQWFMKLIYDLMELIYNAAGLVVDTLRTFILIVLSILGPVVFGIAVWDGLAGSLSAWFTRYISVYLWLPVSSILTALLTKIQILMVQKDIAAMNDPGFLPDAVDVYYLVFFVIGIVGYFSVPTVAGWIIEAGGGIGGYGRNINTAGKAAGGYAKQAAGYGYNKAKEGAAAAGSVLGNVAGRVKGTLIKK